MVLVAKLMVMLKALNSIITVKGQSLEKKLSQKSDDVNCILRNFHDSLSICSGNSAFQKSFERYI